LIVKKIAANRWEVYEDYVYHVGNKNSKDIIRIPKGAKTDFASIPQFLWGVFPPHTKIAGASVIHDYLYQKQGWVPRSRKAPRSRRECDKIFLEAMGVLKMPWWKKQTVYRSVRIFGGFAWNK